MVFSLFCGNVRSNPSLCISNAIFSKTILFCLQPSNYSCMSSEDHISINFDISFPVYVAILSNHLLIQKSWSVLVWFSSLRFN